MSHPDRRAEPSPENESARPRVGVAAGPEQAQEIESLIAAEGGRVRPVFLGQRAERGARQCEALILHVPSRGDLAAIVREQAGTARVPLIALCERLGPGDAKAAIEAGASDCLGLDAGFPLTLAVERALAHAARLESERLRGRELANALERAKKECADVYAASITDWVTGLYNKRYFDERLEEEENKAYRTGRTVSLVLVDLDHFKSVNDTWGHEAGDKVLKDLAAILRHCTRNYDICCRYGGEEFGVILPATRADQALAVADRIRGELKARRFDALSPSARLTASCGIADLPSAGVNSKEELFRAADAALYRAKHAGRDRTVVAEGKSVSDTFGAQGPGLMGSASVVERVERLRAAIRGLSEELTSTTERAMRSLARLADEEGGARFFSCAETIAAYAGRIAKEMQLGAEHIDRIRRAGLLQELGMMPLAASLVHSRSLDDSERELLKQHPALSVRIADEICCLREELPIILHHHERFDGSGYPRGLRGDRIPLGSRVLSVAMAYEAMTTSRPYRGEPMEADAAIAEIERLSGTWYDPQVVGGFKAAFATPPAGI